MKIALAVIIAALLGLAVWGCFGVTQHIIVAIDKIGAAGTGIAETTAKINGTYGTIAEVDKLILTLKSTAVHTDMMVAHQQRQLALFDTQERQLFDDLHGTAADARNTITALNGTAQALTATAGEAQRTLEASQPLLHSLDMTAQSSTATVDALHTRISDPRIDALMLHLDATAENGEHISGDAAKVTNHFEQRIDHPTQSAWYARLLPATLQLAWQAYMAAK